MPAPTSPYQTKLLSDHKLAAIRPSMLLAPDSPTRDTAAPTSGTSRPSLALHQPGNSSSTAAPTAPAASRRDGTDRFGVIVPLDVHNRICAKKLHDALGWDNTTDLVVEVQPGAAVVRAGRPTATAATLQPTRVDKHSRLRLPPAAKGALQVQAGDEVVACAVPQTGELHLAAGKDLLPQMTGVITPLVRPEPAPAAPTPTTRVRRASSSTDVSARSGAVAIARALRPHTVHPVGHADSHTIELKEPR